MSGGLRHGEMAGLTTLDVLPPGRQPEVAFAGVWAQACWRHGRRPSQREMYGVFDGTGRKDRTMLCAAGGGTATGVGITPMLERCWPAICAVAARLFSHSQVSHDEVTKALGLSVDPDTAAIRGSPTSGRVVHRQAHCDQGAERLNVGRPPRVPEFCRPSLSHRKRPEIAAYRRIRPETDGRPVIGFSAGRKVMEQTTTNREIFWRTGDS